MSEGMTLVTNLAVILVAAGVFTIISKALKQPVILGYIIAGFLVSPHLGLLPQEMTSPESVKQWSEIGIIFMMFGLGLEFSFRKLLKVGSAALIIAGTKCLGMFIPGIILGKALGWSMMESMFLGGMMSMSSTMIIIKAYDDLGLKNKPYASVIFGSLVVEDLIAVLLMVLLSALAATQSFNGLHMLLSLGKLAFFLVLWFVVGIYLIPSILKKTKKWLSDEILLVVSIGLCFAMVAIANAVGFSSALGAFVMGSILSETVEGETISKLTKGIKDLFGAIFFVSVGMMVDPAIIAGHWSTILVITVVAMTGILIFSSCGAIIAGKGLDTAVHAGFSLAQLGEFSFILAALGCSLGVMREFIYPMIISVSVITTFTAPYMIKLGDPASRWLFKKLPARVIKRINPPQEDSRESSLMEKGDWKRLLTSYFIRIGVYSVILIAIEFGLQKPLGLLSAKVLHSLSGFWQNFICTVTTLALMSPFLYGLAVRSGSITAPATRLLKQKDSNKWPIISLILLRSLLAVWFIVSTISLRFQLSYWAILLMALAFVTVIILGRRSVHKFTFLEDRFFENLNEKEFQEQKQAPISSSVRKKLEKYDIRIEPVCISSDFEYSGKTLREMPFRHRSGVNIIEIRRGSRDILIPSGDEIIFPGDKLLAVGTNDQLEMFKNIIGESTVKADPVKPEFAVLRQTVDEGSMLYNNTLRSLDLRSSGCMVISILHDNTLITNPKADYIFECGDIVWLAGTTDSLKYITNN